MGTHLLGAIASLFEKWSKYYLSLDGIALRFFDSKASSQAVYTYNVDDISTYRVELSGIDRLAVKRSKLAFSEDGYSLIIRLMNGDEIHIKFVDAATRGQWVYVIDNVVQSWAEERSISPL